MKFLSLFLMLLTSEVKAIGLESCGTFSFKGMPRISGKEMVLVINEKSMSEVVLTISMAGKDKIAPYINIMTAGELTLSKVTGTRSGIIETFSKLDYSTPDPINTTLHSFIRPLEKKKCP
jgi:hypothetical protein